MARRTRTTRGTNPGAGPSFPFVLPELKTGPGVAIPGQQPAGTPQELEQMHMPAEQVAATAMRRAQGFADDPRNRSSRFPRLNPVDLPSKEWTALWFERDMLLTPSDIDSNLDGILYYAPDLKPSSTNNALRSKMANFAYVPGAGRWWFYNDSSQAVRYLQVAADNPAAAMPFFATASSQKVTTLTVAAGSIPTSAGNAAQLIARNIDRKGVVLQNNDTAVNLWYKWDQAAGVPLTATTGYLVLYPKDAVFWSGDNSISQNMVVMSAGTHTGPISVASIL